MCISFIFVLAPECPRHSASINGGTESSKVNNSVLVRDVLVRPEPDWSFPLLTDQSSFVWSTFVALNINKLSLDLCLTSLSLSLSLSLAEVHVQEEIVAITSQVTVALRDTVNYRSIPRIHEGITGSHLCFKFLYQA